MLIYFYGTPFTHFRPHSLIFTWHIFIVSIAARCVFFVTPAQHVEATCTVISGHFALSSIAFETTQMSVHNPTSSTSSYFSVAIKSARAKLPNEGLSKTFTALGTNDASSSAICQPAVFSTQCTTGK